MDIHRHPHVPLHGRAQVMLPDQRVVSGHSQDISCGGVCLLLDDPIPLGIICTLRFELFVGGRSQIIIASAKPVYGVFASQGGFRAGFSFAAEDSQRKALIASLIGKMPREEAKGAEHRVSSL